MIRGLDDVLQRLARVDAELKEFAPDFPPIPVTLIGGAAVIVYGGRRWSRDIDVVASPGRRFFGLDVFHRHGIHLVSEALVNLHPDWDVRVQQVPGASYSRLAVSVLDPYDLAIAKIARGTERDLQDVRELAPRLDPKRLAALYREAMRYWIGRQEAFEGALQHALSTVFEARSEPP